MTKSYSCLSTINNIFVTSKEYKEKLKNLKGIYVLLRQSYSYGKAMLIINHSLVFVHYEP